MKIPSYLQYNRFGIYYFRRSVPGDIKPVIGKREIIRSLRTGDPKEAVSRNRILTVQVDRLFSKIRHSMANRSNINMEDETFKIHYGTELEIKPDGTTIQRREVTPEDIRALKEAGLSPEQITDFLRNSQDHLPSSPPATSTPSPQSAEEILLSDLIQKFYQDKKDSNGGKWTVPTTYETKFRRLIELVGDVPCENVNRETARSVRRHLQKLPSDTSKYRGMSAQQMIAANPTETLNALKLKTESVKCQYTQSS